MLWLQSLIAGEDFQHILRLLNTNVDGKQKIMFALTSIKGVGRRFSNIVCKKADIDMNKRQVPYFSLRGPYQISLVMTGLRRSLCWRACRAGELSPDELERLMTVVANPRQFKVPDWFLNRKKDYKDGRFSQVVSNALDMKLRDDLERLKKIRSLLPSTLWFLPVSQLLRNDAAISAYDIREVAISIVATKISDSPIDLIQCLALCIC